MGKLKIGLWPLIFFLFSWTVCQAGLDEELAAEIARIKTLGEPITLEELVPKPLPKEENAAFVYRQAFSLKEELKKKYAKTWKNLPYEGTMLWQELPGIEKDKIVALLLDQQDFQTLYALIEKAVEMKCQFLAQADYEKAAARLLPHLNEMRSLVRLVAARMTAYDYRGKPVKSLENSLVGLKLSQAFSREPLLVTSLVRMAMDEVILNRLEECWISAPQELIRSLQNLIGEKRKENLIYQGLLGERVLYGLKEIERQAICSPREGARNPGIEAIFPNPLTPEEARNFWKRQQLIYFRFMSLCLEMAKNPYWIIRDKLNQTFSEINNLPDLKGVITKQLLSPLKRAFLTEASYKARLGLASLALACCLYRLKSGNYPLSLEELAPEFFSELPLDPFTGQKYHYRVTELGFLIYSVGQDGQDDGGQKGKPGQEEKGDIVWEVRR
ncbi:MAG: hypothetical protein NC911_07550 [Candidatus Omnitrophica bacterium]|nr:hypothetical protein [Candidatus Omnitrophota bacterium]